MIEMIDRDVAMMNKVNIKKYDFYILNIHTHTYIYIYIYELQKDLFFNNCNKKIFTR